MATNVSTEQNNASGITGESCGSATSESTAMCAVLAQNWRLVALRGALGVIFGALTLLNPQTTLLVLVLFFAAYMLTDGVLAIISAVRAARKSERWGLLILEGVTNIAAGVVAFLWPGITVLAFTMLIAAWAIFSGGLMFSAAFRLTQRYGRWWLGAAGMLSVIFGFLLILAPPIGAIVLTIWLGAYALMFGGVLLVLAFRLRSQQRDSGAADPSSAFTQGA